MNKTVTNRHEVFIRPNHDKESGAIGILSPHHDVKDLREILDSLPESTEMVQFHYYVFADREFLDNVQEHAPPLAGAHVETGGEG